MIAKVKTLTDLRLKATSGPHADKYKALAIAGANNLGASVKTLDAALDWLHRNALETDERGVVAEVNFCRDLVKS